MVTKGGISMSCGGSPEHAVRFSSIMRAALPELAALTQEGFSSGSSVCISDLSPCSTASQGYRICSEGQGKSCDSSTCVGPGLEASHSRPCWASFRRVLSEKFETIGTKELSGDNGILGLRSLSAQPSCHMGKKAVQSGCGWGMNSLSVARNPSTVLNRCHCKFFPLFLERQNHI